MKKKIYLLAIVSLFFFSCQKEQIYSCDENINEWVKDNSDQINQYNRIEISKFEISYQQAMLRFLSPEKRKKIWEEKVEYINNLDWNNEEKAYINFFTQSFKKIDYSNKNIVENNKLNDLMVVKLKEAILKFNWSQESVFELFFTVNNLNTYNSELLSQNKAAAENQGCNCRYDIGCAWALPGCEQSNCEVSSSGCGVFGGAECTGICWEDKEQEG